MNSLTRPTPTAVTFDLLISRIYFSRVCGKSLAFLNEVIFTPIFGVLKAVTGCSVVSKFNLSESSDRFKMLHISEFWVKCRVYTAEAKTGLQYIHLYKTVKPAV